jgi:hypothetical protein
MKRTTKGKLTVHLLKPIWELSLVIEKLPESMPSDMKRRLLAGAALTVCSTVLWSGFFFVNLGFLTWTHLWLILQTQLLAGAIIPLIGAAQGLRKASKQAALEAGSWRREQLGDRQDEVPRLE